VPFPVKHPFDQTPPPVTVVLLVPENITPFELPEQAELFKATIAFPKARGAGGYILVMASTSLRHGPS